MVRDETINRVVHWLSWEVTKNQWLKDKAEKTLGIDCNKQGFEEELGQAMFELNIAGVNTRYGQGEAEKFRQLDYRYAPAHCSEIQVLKSLQCFLYQCMEGEVVKRLLYQFLVTVVEHHLMSSIISDLPEYDRAEWG